MISKETYTKIFLKQADISLSEAAIKEYTPVWWQNTRAKDSGGLRLTDEGFDFIRETLVPISLQFGLGEFRNPEL